MKLQYEPNAFYRWSLQGRTPVQRFARSKHDGVSFFGALSQKTKKQIAMLVEEKQNSESMIAYLEHVKEQYAPEIVLHRRELEQIRKSKGTKKKYRGLILFILDGASFHRSKALKLWLDDDENYGIFELMRLPAYSPHLNPQEHVWKALRKHLAKVAGQYRFQEMIDRACRFLRTETFDFSFV